MKTSTRPEARVPNNKKGAASMKIPRKIVVNIKNLSVEMDLEAIKYCELKISITRKKANPKPKIKSRTFFIGVIVPHLITE
jgi:hypothetical protein